MIIEISDTQFKTILLGVAKHSSKINQLRFNNKFENYLMETEFNFQIEFILDTNINGITVGTISKIIICPNDYFALILKLHRLGYI